MGSTYSSIPYDSEISWGESGVAGMQGLGEGYRTGADNKEVTPNP